MAVGEGSDSILPQSELKERQNNETKPEQEDPIVGRSAMDYRWLIDGFEALTSFLLQSSPSLVLFSFFSAWGHCGSQLCHLVIDFSRSVHRPLASVKRLALFAGPYFREIQLNFPFLLLTRTGHLADVDQELSCSATSPRTWVGQPPLLLLECS